MEAKRKIIQFFVHGDNSLVLCEDGGVFSFRETYDKGVQKIIWKRRPELENPQEETTE